MAYYNTYFNKISLAAVKKILLLGYRVGGNKQNSYYSNLRREIGGPNQNNSKFWETSLGLWMYFEVRTYRIC